MRSLPERPCPLSWTGATCPSRARGLLSRPKSGRRAPRQLPSVVEAKRIGGCPPGQISRAHAPEDTKSANWQRAGPGQDTPSAPVQLAPIPP